MNDREREITALVHRTLDESARRLDEVTLAGLRRARRRALEASDRPPVRAPAWAWGGGLAVAGLVLAVAVLLLFDTGGGSAFPGVASVADLELLLTRESPEFYAELDFYRWLASQNDAG